MLEPFFFKKSIYSFTIFKVNLDLAFPDVLVHIMRNSMTVRVQIILRQYGFFIIKFGCLVPTENYIAESS